MGKIFCIMGKSSSGKDTIYQQLLGIEELALKPIVLYTTRPIREGEQEGITYFFYDEDRLATLEEQGKIIEIRAYNTIHGIWKYFTADEGQIDLSNNNYLIIGTIDSYEKIKAYFGQEKVVPIYISLEDGVRMQRALDRERMQEIPKYPELCRRFLADELDFSKEKLEAAGIVFAFENKFVCDTVEEVKTYILKLLNR